MENNTLMIAVLVVVAMLVSALGAGFLGAKAFSTTEVKEVEKQVIVKEYIKPNQSEVTTSLQEEMAQDYLKTKYDEKSQNETAKSLVLLEKDTKDFKKEILALLEDNSLENKSVESYKDLTVYSFKIEEVTLDGDEATVIVTFKVSGFESDDEEDAFKARGEAVFTVEGLSVDDKFSDAEVTDVELSLEKFYD